MKLILTPVLIAFTFFSFSQNETDTCQISIPQFLNSACPPAQRGRINFNCLPDTFELKIYNRWGNLVFETDNILIDLEKIPNQTDSLGNKNNLPAGTYFYVLNANFKNENSIKKSDYIYFF